MFSFGSEPASPGKSLNWWYLSKCHVSDEHETDPCLPAPVVDAFMVISCKDSCLGELRYVSRVVVPEHLHIKLNILSFFPLYYTGG